MPIEITKEHARDMKNSLFTNKARESYDAEAKKMISQKIVLAKILKKCVPELENYSAQYIMENILVDKIVPSEVFLDQDVSPMIEGRNTEDASVSEGYVRFDLVFDIQLPGPGKVVRIVVNIEIQKNTKRYSFKRSVYYIARLVSRQKGIIFLKDNYTNLAKVYSIWIVTHPTKPNRNTIDVAEFNRKRIVGKSRKATRNSDLLKVIVISLGDYTETNDELLRFLDIIFSPDIEPEDKFTMLVSEFGIKISESFKEGIEIMYEYVVAFARDRAQTIIARLEEKIKSLTDERKSMADQIKIKDDEIKSRDDERKIWADERKSLTDEITMLRNKLKEAGGIKNI